MQELITLFFIFLSSSGPLKLSTEGGRRRVLRRFWLSGDLNGWLEERVDFSWFPWVVLPFPPFSCHFFNSSFFFQSAGGWEYFSGDGGPIFPAKGVVVEARPVT